VTDPKHNIDVNSNSVDTLTVLYENDKQGQRSPSSIRRSIMLAAKKEELASSTLISQLKHWANTSKSLIATTSLIALITVVWVGQYKLEQGGFNRSEYTNIQIHSFASPQALASDNIRLKYDTAYKDFLLQQGALAAHHQSSAQLRVSNDGWTLATCQKELVQISDELLDVLKDIQRVDIDLTVGDSVNILFAMDGRIIQIIRSPEPLIC
jgi:hypothetical protein